MSACECRCGANTEGGDFLPGHDQKLRVALEERVGGLLEMRDLVEVMESYMEGSITLEELGKAVRRAFWRKRAAV